jgi:peptidoglycan hydrolase-like protein with peptidoglycan-binding domain
MAYTTINGQRVATGVAAAFNKMNADFKKAFGGISLTVASGTRTRAEQEQIFRSRYVPENQVHGRHVYDWRWWNGIHWARVSSAGTVAVPGTSNHEDDGPIGPRAIDVHDNGRDRGVSYFGTPRSNWIRDRARNYGFNPAGFNFGEPWHIEYTGDPYAGQAPANVGSAGHAPATANHAGAGGSPMLHWTWTGIQKMLKGTGRYSGAIDNMAGPGTVRGFQDFLNDSGHGAGAVDGNFGDGTERAAQRWLKAKWGYQGAVDGNPGQGTAEAWHRAEAANGRAFGNVR